LDRLRKKRVKKSAGSLAPKSNRLVKKSFAQDLWDEDGTADDLTQLKEEQEHRLTNKTRRPPARIFNKPNLVPSVQVDPSGASYNPSERDHSMLVNAVIQKEYVKMAKERNLQEGSATFERKTADQIERDYFEEMKQGLGDEEDEGFDDNEEEQSPQQNDAEQKSLRDFGRKTQSQRNKEKRLKIQKRTLAKKKATKLKQGNQVGVKKMIQELKMEEKIVNERIKRRDERIKRDVLQGSEGKKKGKGRIPVKEEVVSLPSNIQGNLRTIRTEGNILEDRFKSLLRRSLIEPRTKITPKTRAARKVAKKSYVKRSHRENVDK